MLARIELVHELLELRTQSIARRHDAHRAVVVDHWDEDWSRLWWVRLAGPARVVDHDARALELLPLPSDADARAGV